MQFGVTHLIRALLQEDMEGAAIELIGRGADIHAVTTYGATAAYFAVAARKARVAESLSEEKVDFNCLFIDGLQVFI